MRLLRLLAFLALISPVALLGWVLHFAGTLERAEVTSPTAADAIIVLTGGADRIEDGLRLLEAGRAKRLLISGVNQTVTMEALRRRWTGHDASFDCCVDLDFRALNTFENARESAIWMRRRGFRSLILVTASYHMPRAQLEFTAALPGIRIVSAPVIPATQRLDQWWLDTNLTRLIALESVKYAAARLRIALGLRG